MLSPREVGCQVDAEMLYVRGIAHGRKYVTPRNLRPSRTRTSRGSLTTLVRTIFAASSAIGFVAAYLMTGSPADTYSALSSLAG